MEKLKKPIISEETDIFTEYEIPEGKSEEYDLPDGCEYVGNGTCFETGEHFEYLAKYKNKDNNPLDIKPGNGVTKAKIQKPTLDKGTKLGGANSMDGNLEDASR